MVNLGSNRKGETKFFGAVTRNCKTVIVERSKNAVKKEIVRRGITGNNVAMFGCQFEGGNTIRKKLIHKPSFKPKPIHNIALTEACLDFVSGNRIS